MTSKNSDVLYDNRKNVSEDPAYDYRKNLNWRIDGGPHNDEIEDPGINEFYKGYQINPYEFRRWANKNLSKKQLEKLSAQEVMPMKFTTDYLADKILTLWNGVDGPLQYFFDGFTLKYDNKLKQDIAKKLEQKGYKIYPTLTDDQPNDIRSRNGEHRQVYKEVMSSNNVDNILKYAKCVSQHCQAVNLLEGEINDLKEAGNEIEKSDASGLAEYYKNIFPEDYAVSLVNIMLDDSLDGASINDESLDISYPHDQYQHMSEESQKQIEDYMSGNADPYYNKDGGGEFGYNFVTDMRNDTTRPTQYETKVSNKKKG
jgi:hypothetical protein